MFVMSIKDFILHRPKKKGIYAYYILVFCPKANALVFFFLFRFLFDVSVELALSACTYLRKDCTSAFSACDTVCVWMKTFKITDFQKHEFHVVR